MREIKFRVWEPCNEKMHHLDFALYKFDGGLNSHKFVLPPNRQGFQNPYSTMNLEAVKIMQYTRLKDKNGKEIYEGDIVRVHEDEDFIWTEQVLENGGGYWVDENYLGAIHSFCEVIGNIYENLELLGDSK